MQERRGTTTSNFGVSGRENHDASGFYDRFVAPELSTDDTIAAIASAARLRTTSSSSRTTRSRFPSR